MAAYAAGPAPRFSLKHWGMMIALGAAYGLLIGLRWSEAYLDFGDGNYLYISSRIAEGIVPYRDILAPQPPCHLFLGAALVRAAQAAGRESPLYVFRAFSLALHLLSYLLVVRLAWRVWGCATTAVTAGAIFLILPLSLWWSLGYQSEPLEIFFLLWMILAAVRGKRWSDLFVGIFGAAAALTNLTAVPFLFILLVFILIRNRWRAIWIAVPAILIATGVTIYLQIWTGGAFLRNVVFNQVGTYPRDQFLDYAWGKILREGGDILNQEGFFIFFAAVGFFRFLRMSPLEGEAREGTGWFFASTLCSFLYVTKGGTEDYIFTLAGPTVAILSAAELVAIGGTIRRGLSSSVLLSSGAGNILSAPATASSVSSLPFAKISPASFPIRLAALGLAAIFFAGLLTAGPLKFPVNFYRSLWDQSAFELPDYDPASKLEDGSSRPNVQQVKEWIERFSKPGDAIISPPYYAFLTGRTVWGDYSEIFIWTIKDKNDRGAKNPEGEGWSKTRELARALDKQEIPLVLLDMNQTGHLPEVTTALESSYQPIIKEPYLTFNTRLGVLIPKSP